MKKRLYTLMAMALAVQCAVFAAGSSESGAAPKAEAQKKTDITFSSWRTEDVAVYEELIKKFEAENPDIHVPAL